MCGILNVAIIFIIGINFNFLICKPFHIYNNQVNYKNVRNKSGSYEYTFNTHFRLPTDDIGASQRGTIEENSKGEVVLKVNGTFHYLPECDHLIDVYYTADENGYVPHVRQFFNRKIEKVDGKIIGYSRICSVANPPQVGAACLASLQGGCVGK
ncbi:hypothetical protein ILUMI_03004 [Ignelater luminosus]|uniref:Uncharacterized protein n=1 Tax=Ignelater luminosus TaxID=2038154 RepID=A0A8K0DH65_IGNLU|nr:hypothetical protein ILUMI_03004 [Ignelater luminosus]